MNYQSVLRKQGTMANIRMITDTLDVRARTAIDIGCDAGSYSAHLSNLGLKVDAYDPDASAVEEARQFFLSNMTPVKLKHQLFTLEDVRKMPVYDVSLLLSVYHQIVEHNGLEYANEYLVGLYRRTKHQLYFQSCMIHLKHRRKMPFVENHGPSILAYFTEVLRASGEPVHAQFLGYSQNNLPASEPFRPLFVFEKSPKREVFTLPSMQTGGFQGSENQLLVVDIDHAVSDQTLTSFSRQGWHPLRAACEDLQAKAADPRGKASAGLKAYYGNFQPQTVGDVWQRAGVAGDIGVLAKQPAGHYGSWLPWHRSNDTQESMQAGYTVMPRPPVGDCHTYGPVAPEVPEQEAARLGELQKKLSEEGYAPEIHHDGYIRGQLLIRGEETRFLVLGGQHRLAVLSTLGYQQIVARFEPRRLRMIDLAKVSEWTQVKDGTYSVEQATAIFNGVFDATGLGLRDALRARAAIALPAVKTYQLVATRDNGWSDQYGSLHVAAQYAGGTLEPGYRMNAIWQHGCEGPWVDFSADLLSNNTPGAKEKFVLVAREEQAALLRSAGYTEAHAIGLPIIYTQPSVMVRQPRSLLVMPTHTLNGEKPADRSAFEKYADEIKAIAGNFARVTVCIHPSCKTNGLWVQEFSSRGFEIIYGAQNTDLNALNRVRALCEQFETVTTNGWGSHVAYALAFGAKVSIYGTQPKRTEADYLRDTTWAADPAALKKWLSDESTARERAFLAAYYQTPMQAVANVEEGRALIGWGHRVSPEQMGQLLGIILTAPVSAARAAPLPVLQQAPALVNTGAKAEAILLLVRAAQTDVASNNPAIVLESLVEIATDLAPLEPKQSNYLFAEAEKRAKAQGLSLEFMQARTAAA